MIPIILRMASNALIGVSVVTWVFGRDIQLAILFALFAIYFSVEGRK